METSNVLPYTSMSPIVVRLEQELVRLKALLGWQVSVRRGKRNAKARRLTPEKIMAALYETRYPPRSGRS